MGGLRTLPFIIGNEAFEKVATVGLSANMILYLTREYNMEATAGGNILFIWSAINNLTPVIGAFIADSYAGRYWMIGFGSIASFLGMVLLWLTAILPQAKPPLCDQGSEICPHPTTSQLLLLYSSLGLMSIGAGGIGSSSLAFGADQLNREENLNNASILQSYFSWYYVAASVAAIISVTCIVYIQDKLGWKVGLGIPAVLMFLSVVSFFLASPLYVNLKANKSLLTGLAQVVVASYKNRHMKLSSEATDEIYHHSSGSTLLKPSKTLRWKSLKSMESLYSRSNRRAKSVDQGDSTMVCRNHDVCVPLSTLLSSNPVEHDGPTPNFQIPAGSFSIFVIISLSLWIALYDRIIVSLASKLTGKPFYISLKKRLGIGLLLSSASMAAWAIAERFRREIAIKEGFSNEPRAVVHMSAIWLLPHLVLLGLAMAFNTIGQTQFYYSELPKSMSSIATSLSGVGSTAANLVSSLIMNIVDDVTKRGGNESWVSTNINKGHYDYYYWILVGLSIANFIYFLACSKAYGPCKEEVDQTDCMSEEH